MRVDRLVGVAALALFACAKDPPSPQQQQGASPAPPPPADSDASQPASMNDQSPIAAPVASGQGPTKPLRPLPTSPDGG